MQKQEPKTGLRRLCAGENGYPPQLHGYLTRKMRSREDARDLAQEAFLRFLQRDLRTIQQPHTYIFRIALNLLHEWSHRRDRTEEFRTQLARFFSPLQEGEEDVIEAIESERLLKVLSAVPENYRRVLWMIKVEEKNHQEVAKELGLSPKTVLIYLARAVHAARQADVGEG